MPKPKISIIIPVNNLENYIRKSLDSVVKQTLKEIEIICVDDGSTDSSLKIIKEFAKNDSRIILLEEETKGQAFARNVGIERATGEYIGFVDGDDWVDHSMFEKMYENAKRLNSEITMCSTKVFDEYKQSLSEDNDYYNLNIFDKSFDDKTFSHLDIPELILDVNVAVWNKIYSREFLQKINAKFKEGYIYEDLPFFYETFLKAEKVSLIRDFLYFYRTNRFGSTMSNVKRKILDRIEMVALTYDMFKALPYYEEIKIKLVAWLIDDLFHRYTLVNQKYKKEFFFRMKKTFLDLDISNIDKNILDNIYYYKEFSFVVKGSFEECNKRFFGVYNTFKKEKNELISQHQEEMCNLSKTCDREKEYEKNKVEQECNLIKTKYEQEFENKLNSQKIWYENEFDLKIEEQKEWMKDELIGQKDKYSQEINSQKIFYEGRLTSQKQIYEFDLNLLKEWFENELKFRLNAQNESYKNEINTILSQQKEFCENEIKIKVDQYSQLYENEKALQLLRQKEQFDEDLIKLLNTKSQEHELELNNLKNRLLAETNEKITQLQAEHDEILNNLRKQLKTENDEQINSLKEQFENDIKTQLWQQSQYYEGEITAQLENQKEQFESDTKTQLWQQSQYYEEEIKTQLESQKDWFENEIDRRIAEVDVWHNKNLEDHLEDQKNFFESRIADLHNSFNDNFNRQKEEYNVQLELQLKQQQELCKNELKNQKNYYNQELITQKQYYEKEISNVRFVLKVVKKLKNINKRIKNLFIKTKNEPIVNRPRVSIIVPVYNVDKYLRQSLDSLVNQYLKNIEIICVNDGSTDNSASILEEYKAKDSRIKVIHKQNAGTGAARNDGLRIATGECIGFVDPDDWVKDNMFERLYNLMKETGADIVMCTPGGFDEKNQVEADFPYFVDANFKKELDNRIFSWKEISPFSYPMCVWNKLYKKELFDKHHIEFAEGLDFEDHKVIFKSLLTAEKIFFIREKLYIYRFNREGSILSDNNARLMDHIKIFDIVEDILNETNTMQQLRHDFITYKIHNLFYYYSMIKEEHKNDYYHKMTESIKATNLSEKEAQNLYKSYPELERIIQEINS